MLLPSSVLKPVRSASGSCVYLFSLLIILHASSPALAQRGFTVRVSLSSLGEEANGDCWYSSISADGRYVAFGSYASNLVPGDTNGVDDIFVHDRQTGETTRVSISSSGQQGQYRSWYPSINADGRYVAFISESDLISGGSDHSHVFVHDRQTGETTRVSVSSSGKKSTGGCNECPISADGRFVAFSSSAPDLVADDTNGILDIFVRDRQTGETTRVSVSSSGQQPNGVSFHPSISADGRYVAFNSDATNLVSGDTNHWPDIFVHDRQSGETTRVSISSSGQQANGGSLWASISDDGRFVAFLSGASNLVPRDTNDAADIFVRTSRPVINPPPKKK